MIDPIKDRLAEALRDMIRYAEMGKVAEPWMVECMTAWLAAYGDQCAGSGAGVVLPRNPTQAHLDALRLGSRRDYPSDELCRVRYAALLAAAPEKDHAE